MRQAVLAGALALGWTLGATAQTLTTGVQTAFGIDPHVLFLGPNMAAARHVFDTLVNRDADSRWTPGLTERWEAVEPQVWELTLRQGVRFQDGSPFSAEDVVFSLQRIPNIPNNPGSYATNLRGITRVEVVGPHTIRFHTSAPNPVLPGQLTNIFIVSAKAAAGASTADFSSGRAAIGTGPYRLDRFSNAEGMSLTRFDGYWGAPPPWARVNVKVIPNDTARLAALLAGDVDLIEEVPTAEVARLEREGRVAVFRRPSDRVMFLQPHVGAERLALITDHAGQPLPTNPLRDPRVRQAISLGLNRTALAERGMDGQAVPQGQLVPEGFGGFDPALLPDRYDPEAARRLLAEAGYPQGFGLTLVCSNNRYVNDGRVCQVVGQMLSRIGIAVKVEAIPSAVFFARVTPARNEAPLVLFGQSSSATRDATHVLSLALHSQDADGFGASNRGHIRDAGLDALIKAAAFRMDAGREDALRAAMREGMRQHAAIPLYTQVTITAARRGIRYTPRLDEQLVAIHARPAQ